MHLAILGAGSVGGTLGRRWAQAGHRIHFGVRSPDGAKTKRLLADIGDSAVAGTVRDAVEEAPVVVLATPWSAARSVIDQAGDLTGKVLIDCINPIGAVSSGSIQSATDSGAEQIAEWAAGADVVKAFNTTGWENMANPLYGDQRATMFYCGAERAKSTVHQLIEEIGFEAIDVGDLKMARHLESMALVWIMLARCGSLGADVAFKLLRR